MSYKYWRRVDYLCIIRLWILSMVFLMVGNTSWSQENISKKAQKKFKTAQSVSAEGKREKALVFLKEAIQLEKDYFEAWKLKSKLETELGQFKEAFASLKKLAELSEAKQHLIYFEMGKVLLQNENFSESINWFSECSVHPSSKNSLKQKCNEHIEIASFRDSLKRNPLPFFPLPLGDSINTAHDEYLPCLTADEQFLYFTRKSGNPPLQNEDFYVSEKKDSTLSLALNLGEPINSIFLEGALSISPDGNRLFFAAHNERASDGGFDLYYSYKVKDKWVLPQNLGAPINTRYWESQPSINADGTELYFASKRPGGLGGIDIWMSRLESNAWQTPVNLGPSVNTALDEQCPFIHADDESLYFSSKGHKGMGGADLFVTQRSPDETWSVARNLGYPINTKEDETSLIINTAGDKGYFSMYSDTTGFDLFQFDVPEQIQPVFVSYVKALVRDAVTKKALRVDIEIIDLEGSPLFAGKTDPQSGVCLATLPSGRNYSFHVSRPGYTFYSQNFELKSSDKKDPFLLEIELAPIKQTVDDSLRREIVLENVFFEINSFELLPSSFYELDKLVGLMISNPEMSIEIAGHTDNTGNEKDNQLLSERRAKAVYEYLLSKQVEMGRLSFKGYGATQPIAGNNTESGRAKNRRTAFKVIY